MSTFPEGTGIMICGHGSRSQAAVDEFAQLSERLRERFPDTPVDYGYLEFATPIIRDGLTALKDRGVKQVLAVPGMLFAAGHAKNDIPSVLNTCAAQLDLEISYGRELAVDLKMLQAAGDRVTEALDAAGGDVPRHETMLVVVGRGGERYERMWNCVLDPDVSWRKAGSGRGSKGEGMGTHGDQDAMQKYGYPAVWFPKDLTLSVKAGEEGVEASLFVKKNKLFGKLESSWRD